MKAAPIGPEEQARLKALRRLRVLDSEGEKMFDDITQMAAAICETPISLVTMIDSNRQWFKSGYDIDNKLLGINQTPRDISFCGHVVYERNFLEIPDTTKDERFYDNPLVVDGPKVSFYAGAPLTTSDGFSVGSLCVVDHRPRELNLAQKSALEALARHVVTLLEMKVAQAEAIGDADSLHQLLDNMKEGVALLDGAGHLRDINLAAAKILGRQRDVCLGEKLTSTFRYFTDEAGVTLTYADLPMERAARTGELQECTLNIHRADGSSVWVSLKIVPLISGLNDDNTRILCTLVDLTESKNAERELRRMAALKKLVLDQANFAVIASDLDGRISLFNKTAERLLGYTAAEVVGIESPALFHDPDELAERAAALGIDLSGVAAADFESLRTRLHVGDANSSEWLYRNRQSHTFPVLLSTVDLKNEAGDIVGYMGLAQDLTEKKRLEANLERQRSSLINNAKMASLGEMAGGMAHEINNPLAIICACAEDLISRAEANLLQLSDVLPTAKRIDDTANRIAKIVRGLKTFSRSSEKDPMTLVPLRQIVDDTLGLCRERFRVNNVQLSVDVPATLLINCRPTQISQVLMNLLNNAFDATEGQENRWVAVSAIIVNSRIEVSVTDSGPPILPEVRSRLAQPFFTTKEVGKGTGLGLSISKGIVENHGGRLNLRENVARTTFVFDLPNYS